MRIFAVSVIVLCVTACSSPYYSSPVPNYSLTGSNLNRSHRWTFAATADIYKVWLDSERNLAYVYTPHSVEAVELHNGESKWEYEVEEPRLFFFSSGTGLTVSQGLVVFNSRRGREIVAVNSATGKPVWQLDVGRLIRGKYGDRASFESMISDNQNLYVLVSADRDDFLIAVRLYSGEILWRDESPRPGDVRGPMAIEGEDLYFLSNPVYRVSTESGQIVERTEFLLESEDSKRPGIYATQGAFLANGNIFGATKDELTALDLTQQEMVWSAAPICEGGEILQKPALLEKSLYFVSTCPSFEKFDQAGKRVWHYDLSDYSRGYTLVGNRGYLLDNHARLHQVDLTTGERIGEVQFQPPRFTRLGDITYHYLESDKDTLLVHFGSRQLFAFDQTSFGASLD